MNHSASFINFKPSRASGLSKLKSFGPSTGQEYATSRNFDFGPQNRSNVSLLSPYISTRLLLEEEVIKEALKHHSYEAAEKFIQEVCWRTYWKGWLELRPSVWNEYRQGLSKRLTELEANPSLATLYRQACNGETEIDCLNAWVSELQHTGYLHNHARMWFASIWIFTLKLPWELGADFFLKHLLDGDSASNTLSWRWVAGLHTQGKYYLAQPDNIRKYTNNRFTPGQLEHSISNSSIDFKKYPPEIGEVRSNTLKSSQQVTLLLHEEDLLPELSPLSECTISNIIALSPTLIDNNLHRSEIVSQYRRNALQDAVSRAEAHFKASSKTIHNPDDLKLHLSETSESIILMRPTVGYLADSLTPILAAKYFQEKTVFQMVRSWDEQLYPYATGGFFKFKKHLQRVVLKHCLPGI